MVQLEQARANGAAEVRNDKERVIPAGLLRALAEAADGYRNSEEPLYFVACCEPVNQRYEVSRAFTSKQGAEEHARLRNSEHRLRTGVGADVFTSFGPFQTTDNVRPKYKVAGVHLEISRGEGAEKKAVRPLKFEGERFDALFYSLPALEKFALPYYSRIHGIEYAAKVREEFVTQDLLLMGHLPNTEPLTYMIPEEGFETPRQLPRLTAVRLVEGQDGDAELRYEIV